jgi:hypothetical protein
MHLTLLHVASRKGYSDFSGRFAGPDRTSRFDPHGMLPFCNLKLHAIWHFKPWQ